jgi:hypothetical protein
MSYSIDFTASDKASAKAKTIDQLDEVVRVQPVHAADRDVSIAAIHGFIDVLVDDPHRDIRVLAHGSVSRILEFEGHIEGAPLVEETVGVSFGASAMHVPRVSKPD